jgi:O-antigen/teichoic acid export membrane protein
LGSIVHRSGSLRAIRALPWRRGMAFAGIEVVSLAYLRADLLFVGRMLGAGVGATYGMVYRVLDALTTAVGSVGLWLFAEGVTDTEATGAAEHLRERSLVLVPRLSFAVAMVALLVSETAGELLSLSNAARITLQLLVASFPLLTVNSLELHVRSGTGRNREVLRIGTVAVLVNIAGCLVLISWLGLVGAAVALLLSETTQSLMLLAVATAAERARVGRSLWLGIVCGCVLVALGAAVHSGMYPAAGAAVAAAIAILASPFLHRRRVVVTS